MNKIIEILDNWSKISRKEESKFSSKEEFAFYLTGLLEGDKYLKILMVLSE